MRVIFSSLAQFRRGERGNVVLVFAITAPVLIAFVMAVFDYGSMSSEKVKLQSAADAAALVLGPLAPTTSLASLQARAGQIVNTYSPNKDFQISKLEVTNGGTQLLVAVQADYKLKYLKAPGLQDAYRLSAYATSVVSTSTYEIALAFDNSGSMNSSAGGATKMQSAKDAANKLIDAMMGSQLASTRTRFSLVPFTVSVNVGSQYANQSWMDRTSTIHSSIHFQNIEDPTPYYPGANLTRFDLFNELNIPWGGCVETRPGDWGVTDAAPVPNPTLSTRDSLFVPMTAPDEPDSFPAGYGWTYPNNYLDDNPNQTCGHQKTGPADYDFAQRKICKYTRDRSGNPPVVDTTGGRGPNFGCNAQPLSRLTGNATTLHAGVNGMVANGSTNLLEGFMWGWRTISPNAPFADGLPYGATNNKKYIILLTDGMNSWNAKSNHNKSDYSSAGFYTNARLGSPAPTTFSEARAQMDAKTLQACTNAKAQGITVYTVGFSVSTDPIDQAGLNLLNQCASSPAKDYAFVANNSSGIISVFEDIARRITGLRLAR